MSDLHFGALEPERPAALRAALLGLAPDLIVVSGDLSQRGTVEELQQARDWLDTVPIPQVLIPGNHDLPRGWRFWNRFRKPWRRYRKIVSDDLEPVWRESGLLVIGTNTARSAGWSHDWSRGRISPEQLERIHKACAQAPPETLKVLAMHHPPAGPDAGTRRALLGRRELFFESVSIAGIDLILAGHFHTSYAVTAGLTGPDQRNCVLSVTSTATSRRRKGEPNGFHVIEGDGTSLRIGVWQFTSPEVPEEGQVWRFHRAGGHWGRELGAGETGTAEDGRTETGE